MKPGASPQGGKGGPGLHLNLIAPPLELSHSEQPVLRYFEFAKLKGSVVLHLFTPKYVCFVQVKSELSRLPAFSQFSIVQNGVTGVMRLLDLDVGERQGYTLDGSGVRHGGPPHQQI